MNWKKTIARLPLVIACIAGLSFCGFFCLFVAASGGSDRGSPQLAAEWRAALLAAAGPDEAAALDRDVVVLRFANGEWAFGKSQSSHGMWLRGGGTMVIRDSKGQVRAFFGHVCGPRYLEWAHGYFLPSLDAFYEKTLEQGMVEHIFPGD
ncbi:hypothetical protein [Zavarzinella formosa]|uniref:hypothetical protein n=1 Tax=Zavarzinella formosa TaxID=360055 RepID=UPI0002D3BA16|nr:hypothetical protein [Zavarzinella formosa]